MTDVSRMKDRYGQLDSIESKGQLFTIMYGVRTGGIHFWSNEGFQEFMYQQKKLSIFYELQTAIGMLLSKKFHQQHLKLDQELINITSIEVDQIVERYKFEHPIIHYYLNEVLK